MASKRDYYEVLGVEKTATDDELKKAYRKLAKKYHPDMNSGSNSYLSEDKFKELTEAYRILSNKALRAQYDEEIGLGSNNFNVYNNLYSEQERLKKEVQSLKMEKESQKYVNKKQKERENSLNPKKYFQIIGTALYNETKKSKEERSKDIFALVLTIIIVAIIVFVFWKVPVLKKFLFP